MREWKYQYCRDCADGNCDMRITDEVICDYYKPKPQTNADYITSSIDAFAKFMSEHAACHEFKCPAKRSYIREDGCHDDCTMTEENCVEAWCIWLTSGVENVER